MPRVTHSRPISEPLATSGALTRRGAVASSAQNAARPTTAAPAAAAAALPAATSSGATVSWTTYGSNLASHRYSAADQITRDNFNRLQIAWRLKTDFLGPRPDTLYSATPLLVDRVREFVGETATLTPYENRERSLEVGVEQRPAAARHSRDDPAAAASRMGESVFRR